MDTAVSMKRRPPNAPLVTAPQKPREANPSQKRLSSSVATNRPKIEGVRVLRADEVDEDSDSEPATGRMPSLDSKSGTVSRTTSLERGAGSALQLVRLSRRNSDADGRKDDLLGLPDLPGLPGRGPTPQSNPASRTSSAAVSRSSSMAGGRHSTRTSAATTPAERSLDLPPHASAVDLRTDIRNQRYLDTFHAMEQKIEQRAQHDPANVLLKRWLSSVCLALAAKRWLEKGLGKVAVYQKEMWAFDTITHLFLPLWQLFRHRRRMKAQRTIHKFIYKVIRKIRLHRRHESADMIRYFLRNKMNFLRQSSRYMVSRAVIIQRAFRLMNVRRKAQVELQFRKLRRLERATYWERAATILMEDWRDQVTRLEVAFQQQQQQQQRFGMRKSSVNTVPAPKAPTPLPFQEVGELPERMLRRLLRGHMTRKGRTYHRDMTLRRRNATEQMLQARRSSCGSFAEYANPRANARRVQVHKPTYKPFLTTAELEGVMDAACIMVGELRGEKGISAHASLLQARGCAIKSRDPNAQPMHTFRAFDDGNSMSLGKSNSTSMSIPLERGGAKQLSFTVGSFEV